MNSKTVSHIARDFQKYPINSELLTVPGISESSAQKLMTNLVNTTEQLIGQFFLRNRDEVAFIEYLEDVGVPNRWACECAENMVHKFRHA